MPNELGDGKNPLGSFIYLRISTGCNRLRTQNINTRERISLFCQNLQMHWHVSSWWVYNGDRIVKGQPTGVHFNQHF